MGTAPFHAGPPLRVFLSYRRQEAEYVASWLDRLLVEAFGRNNVFTDVVSIDLGEDYVDRIKAAVEASDVVLVLIGRQWAAREVAPGRRRLDEPDDLVRVEIETALRAGRKLVPVLLDGASMPGAEDLPESLVPLTTRQATVLSAGHFVDEVGRLVAALRRLTPSPRRDYPVDRDPPSTRPQWAAYVEEAAASNTAHPPLHAARGTARELRAVLIFDDGSSVELAHGEITLGRGQATETHVRVPDTGCSRRHIAIHWDGVQATVTDLGSTNGTTVNRTPVQTWALADGDVIRIGHTSLVFRLLRP